MIILPFWQHNFLAIFQKNVKNLLYLQKGNIINTSIRNIYFNNISYNYIIVLVSYAKNIVIKTKYRINVDRVRFNSKLSRIENLPKKLFSSINYRP